MEIQTQKQLDKATKYWQRVLRLQDWEILATFSPPNELPDDAYAINSCMGLYKRSRIKIRHPKDNTRMVPNVIEHSLIHELLHCHLHVVSRGKKASDAEELVIESLAGALMEIKYGVRPLFFPE